MHQQKLIDIFCKIGNKHNEKFIMKRFFFTTLVIIYSFQLQSDNSLISHCPSKETNKKPLRLRVITPNIYDPKVDYDPITGLSLFGTTAIGGVALTGGPIATMIE